MVDLDEIRAALLKAEAKVKRIAAQLDAAVSERDELQTAARVIERLVEAKQPSTASAAQSDNGQLIYSFVGVGPENARAPKDVIDALKAEGHDLNDDLVRTQLWRMAKRNELRKAEGRYWRPESPKSDDDFDELLNEKNEAPDPLSPEAIKEFGRVAELEVPARSEQHPFRKGENVGSSPTPPSRYQDDDFVADLDDDIPF